MDNKFLKYFLISGLAISMVACTDLEEELVGDITQDINVDGIDIDDCYKESFPLGRLYYDWSY